MKWNNNKTKQASFSLTLSESVSLLTEPSLLAHAPCSSTREVGLWCSKALNISSCSFFFSSFFLALFDFIFSRNFVHPSFIFFPALQSTKYQGSMIIPKRLPVIHFFISNCTDGIVLDTINWTHLCFSFGAHPLHHLRSCKIHFFDQLCGLTIHKTRNTQNRDGMGLL